MRISRELIYILLLGCGTDIAPVDEAGVPDEVCETELTYQNFGEPFMLDWCRGCHSAGLPVDMRQDAPLDANFEQLAEIRARSALIIQRATGSMPTMPPAAGPSDQERAMLAEWLACGAP